MARQSPHSLRIWHQNIKKYRLIQEKLDIIEAFHFYYSRNISNKKLLFNVGFNHNIYQNFI